MTSTHGCGGRAPPPRTGFSKAMSSPFPFWRAGGVSPLIEASGGSRPPLALAAGRPLEVSAELVTHRRQHLFGEGVLHARAEARVQRRRQHIGGHRLLDGGQYRPAAL